MLKISLYRDVELEQGWGGGSQPKQTQAALRTVALSVMTSDLHCLTELLAM